MVPLVKVWIASRGKMCLHSRQIAACHHHTDFFSYRLQEEDHSFKPLDPTKLEAVDVDKIEVSEELKAAVEVRALRVLS